MKKILYVLILFPIICLGQKPNPSEYYSAFEKLSYSLNDQRFAELLLSFFHKIDAGIYDKKSLMILKTLEGKTSNFNEYKDLIQLSLKLPCEELIKSPENQTNYFADHWKNLLKKYCRINLLENISKGQFDKANEELFKLALINLLKGESSKTFLNFIGKISKDTTLGPKVLETIVKTILESEIVPSQEVIQKLEISQELTTFLQTKKLFQKNQGSIFLKEFNSIVSTVLADTDIGLQSPSNPALAFLKNNQSFLPSDQIYKSLNILAAEQLRAKQKEKALEIYRMCEKFSPSDKKLESHFLLLWPSIFTNNFGEAVRLMKEFNMLENFDSYPAKVKFWMAYSLLKNNDLILAKDLFKRLINDKHFDYYSILATKTLNSLSKVSESKILLEQTVVTNLNQYLDIKKLKGPFLSNVVRVFLWLDLGREDLYKMELDRLLAFDSKETVISGTEINSDIFKTWLIFNLLGLLNQKEHYLNTFKLAFDSIDKNYLKFSLPTLKKLFPMVYISKIKEIEPGIDPIIILSLIRQESAFNPRARSIAGARGLMQLMPNTALTLNKRIKKDQLSNPDINLELGILYLKKLLNKYDGDLIQTLSAYNAGENRLKIWMKDYFLNQDPLVMVETIPYEETRNYVKLIYRNIFFYKFLTNDPGTFLPIEESFKVVKH